MSIRRLFITRLIGMLSAIPILGNASLRANTAIADSPSSVQDQFRILVDTCVPRDDYPGAVDEGIDRKLLSEISANPIHLKRVHDLLIDIDKLSRSQFKQVFVDLELSNRTRLLDRLLNDKTLVPDQRAELSYLRARVLQLFYTSESGFAMLDYHPPSHGGYPDYAKPLDQLS